MATSGLSDHERKLKYMQAFRSLGPPTYAGNSDSLEAEDWLRGVTKCMDSIDVPVKLRVTLAAFMITGEADRWWEFTQRGRHAGSITWEDFERRFRKMYFPNRAQCSEKSREFSDLTQGDLTVAQYAAKFIHLSRYAPYYVENEDLKKDMFIRGLKLSINMKMSPSENSTFEDVVQQALILEYLESSRERREETSDSEGSGSGGKTTRNTSSSQCSRWGPYTCCKCGASGHTQRNCPANQSRSD